MGHKGFLMRLRWIKLGYFLETCSKNLLLYLLISQHFQVVEVVLIGTQGLQCGNGWEIFQTKEVVIVDDQSLQGLVEERKFNSRF